MLNDDQNDFQGYHRDPENGALLATDSTELFRHKTRKNDRQRVDELEKIVSEIKTEMKNLKILLHACLAQPK